MNRNKTCEYFEITIDRRGLSTITWNGTLKERLKKFKDIVSVIINYKNRNEEIFVIWNEKDDYSNKYQRIEEYDGSIVIKISKGADENE